VAAPALARLGAATRDAEPTVRAAAAEALAACGGASQLARLEALAGEPGEPPQVVAAALHALGRLAAGPAGVLERGLAHPDAEVAKEATYAASRLPGEEGRRLLRLAATSPRWDVRAAAARGMSERRDGALRADASLLAALDPDPLVARAFGAAARALAEAAGD
jgi:HEAT repeat protein